MARVHAFPDRSLGTLPAGPGTCAQTARVAVPLGGGKPRLLHRVDRKTIYLCRECLVGLWKDECDERSAVGPWMSRSPSEFNQQPERFLRSAS